MPPFIAPMASFITLLFIFSPPVAICGVVCAVVPVNPNLFGEVTELNNLEKVFGTVVGTLTFSTNALEGMALAAVLGGTPCDTVLTAAALGFSMVFNY
jgi:hypothetical protein